MSVAYLTAEETAAELGVSVATVYAYVSRGLLRSEPQPGSRRRLYRLDDVRGLREGRDEPVGEPAPTQAARHWPVIDSAITLLRDEAVFYRGRDVADLAQHSSLEAVARLLWETTDPDPFAQPPPALPNAARPHRDDPIHAILGVLPDAALADRRAFIATPAGMAETGARILRLMAGVVTGAPAPTRPLHEHLSTAWRTGHTALLRAALVLSADHELNASTLAARTVASTGGTLYMSVIAGLAALSGPRHGGMTDRVDALINRLLDAANPVAALTDHLRRGDDLPGFGHPLYPKGDPRARILLDLIDRALPGDLERKRIRTLANAAVDLADRAPTIDFALAALARILKLPRRAPLTLFALGRTTGWVAHAMEQSATQTLIRPRARYVGRLP